MSLAFLDDDIFYYRRMDFSVHHPRTRDIRIYDFCDYIHLARFNRIEEEEERKMNFKVLICIVLYYSLMSIMFMGISPLNNPEIGTSNINMTEVTDGQTPPENESFWSVFGAIFDNVIKFFAFVGFGVVLGGSAPGWFALGFATFQTAMSIFSVAFIIDAIWGG